MRKKYKVSVEDVINFCELSKELVLLAKTETNKDKINASIETFNGIIHFCKGEVDEKETT